MWQRGYEDEVAADAGMTRMLCCSRLPCSASTVTSAATTSVTYLTSAASSSPPPVNTDDRDVSPACVASNIDNDRYVQNRKQLRRASGKTLQLQVSTVMYTWRMLAVTVLWYWLHAQIRNLSYSLLIVSERYAVNAAVLRLLSRLSVCLSISNALELCINKCLSCSI